MVIIKIPLLKFIDCMRNHLAIGTKDLVTPENAFQTGFNEEVHIWVFEKVRVRIILHTNLHIALDLKYK